MNKDCKCNLNNNKQTRFLQLLFTDLLENYSNKIIDLIAYKG